MGILKHARDGGRLARTVGTKHVEEWLQVYSVKKPVNFGPRFSHLHFTPSRSKLELSMRQIWIKSAGSHDGDERLEKMTIFTLHPRLPAPLKSNTSRRAPTPVQHLEIGRISRARQHGERRQAHAIHTMQLRHANAARRGWHSQGKAASRL